MLKRKAIVDFLMKILATVWFRPQLPVLLSKNRLKPEVAKNGRKYVQMEGNSRLSNEHIRNHMVSTSTSGFIAEKLVKTGS